MEIVGAGFSIASRRGELLREKIWTFDLHGSSTFFLWLRYECGGIRVNRAVVTILEAGGGGTVGSRIEEPKNKNVDLEISVRVLNN